MTQVIERLKEVTRDELLKLMLKNNQIEATDCDITNYYLGISGDDMESIWDLFYKVFSEILTDCDIDFLGETRYCEPDYETTFVLDIENGGDVVFSYLCRRGTFEDLADFILEEIASLRDFPTHLHDGVFEDIDVALYIPDITESGMENINKALNNADLREGFIKESLTNLADNKYHLKLLDKSK